MKDKSDDPTAGREIFLSYAAADKALAERLSHSLKQAGQAVWIDSEDIRYADDWRDAVLPAIERAPAVLFLSSPSSLASENCLAELEYAEMLGKRIIPLVARAADEVPESLKFRVRRDFRDEKQFDEELLRLIRDIDSEPDYVDRHTHLAFRAARWKAEGTSILDTHELKQADAWLAAAKTGEKLEPRPTALIIDFIDASRRARRKRRLVTSALLALAIAVTAGGYLGFQWWFSIPRSGIELQLADGNNEAQHRRTADGVQRLRTALDARIPAKRDKNRLLMATWNIRNLGSSRLRSDEALHYIAEIISHFDIVAIQEVKADLAHFDRILQLLGRGWKSFESDVNEGREGNRERLAFLYDSRKLKAGRLVGELGVESSPETDDKPYRSPYFASFDFAGRELAFCTVHIRYGREPGKRHDSMRRIASALISKVERGHDFSGTLILLGDVQGGSAGGTILDAIEESGFLLPAQIRDLSTSVVRDDRPYDQIALRLDPTNGLVPGEGGIFDFYAFVFSDKQEPLYSDEPWLKPGRKYRYLRSLQMSDHLPKWLELRTGLDPDRR